MKIRLPLLLLALFGLVAGSCNRHSWEETKVLYKEHEKHADGEKHEGTEGKAEGGEKH